MPLALNDSGDAMYYDGKAWKNAPIATNSQGQRLFYDGKSWVQPNPNALLKQGQPKIPTAEEEALQPVAEDPIHQMQQHPYATAALTGAALGPAVPALTALAGESGAAAAGLGAAEQMGYQGISDLGQKVAGPEHPILGAIPGLVAPFAAQGAIRGMSGIAGGRLATQAAATEEGAQVARRLQSTAQQAAEQQSEQVRALVTDQAQHHAEEVLGITAPQAAALANPTNINAQDAQKLSAAKNALWEVRRKARQAIGQEYDPIFESVDKMDATPENMASVAEGARGAIATVKERGRTLGSSTKKLLSDLAPESSQLSPEDMKVKISDIVSGKADRRSQARYEELWRKWADEHPTKELPAGGLNQFAKQAIEEQQGKRLTVGQLRGKLGELRDAADAPGLNDTERGAIFEASKPIIKILDNAIPDEQKPILAGINAKYAQVSKLMPRRSMRGLSAAGTLPALGQVAFSEKNRALTSLALSQMDDPQKGLMRDAWASWVMSEKGSGKELFNYLSSNKDTIQRLNFPSDLGSTADLYNLVNNAKKMEKVPSAAAQQEFMDGVRPIFKENGYSKEALEAADKALKGAAGSRIPWQARYPLIYAPLSGLMGFGLYAHAPALVPPAVAFGIPYLMRKTIPNTSLLPLYRQMVMAGWTKAGGEAYARMIIAATRNAIQAAAKPTVRPDKERAAEAMTP